MFLFFLVGGLLTQASSALAQDMSMAMGPGVHYQGVINARASNNHGARFNKNFRVTVDYRFDFPLRAKATSAPATFCDVDNVGSSGFCKEYCVTKATFELGSAAIRVVNLENGQVYDGSKPVKAVVSRSVAKGARKDCSVPDSLDGEKVFSSEVGVLFFMGGQSALYLAIDPMTPQIREQDHVYRSSLIGYGGDSYEILSATPNSSTILFWQYSETVSLGTSGYVPLK